MVGRIFLSSSPQTISDRVVRFASCWFALFLTLLLMALAEGLLLWSLGVKYVPKSSLRHVSVGDFAVSADGRWGASRVKITRHAFHEGHHYDVVLHDLAGPNAIRLHLG